jgi:hypothetical protein
MIQKPSELVDLAKEFYGIKKPNEDLTDKEIALLVRSIAQRAPDYSLESNVYGVVAIGLILFITLMVFPRLYEELELSQPN